MLSFPLFQSLVVTAFGFDDFTGVWILIDLYLARFAAACFGLDGWSATGCLRIEENEPKARRRL